MNKKLRIYEMIYDEWLRQSKNIKPIKGYESRYCVTKDAKVWSIKHKRFLKPFQDRHGYLEVCLMVDGIKHWPRVHRLVAEAFIKNPKKKPMVNHKDMDIKNNNVKNLEWVTNSENLKHAINFKQKKRIHKAQ